MEVAHDEILQCVVCGDELPAYAGAWCWMDEEHKVQDWACDRCIDEHDDLEPV